MIHCIDLRVMIIVSIIAGILSTMNVWTSNLSDIRFHLNDIYMVILMTGWMILLMLLYSFTQGMNIRNIYLILSILTIIISFYCIRNQTFIMINSI